MTNSRFILAAAIPLLLTTSAAAQSTCTNATLVGQYGINLEGSSFATPQTTGPTFQRSIGLFTADGLGLAKANLMTSLNGVVSTAAYTGSYAVQPNCTANITLNGAAGPIILTIGLGSGGQSAVLAGTSSTLAISGALRKAPSACFGSTLSAGYSWESNGEAVPTGGPVTAVSGFINVQFDGKGSLTGGLVRVQLGAPVTISINGQYTLNADCTGSIRFSDPQGLFYNFTFVVVDGGASLLVLQTDPAIVNSGIAVSSSLATSSGSVAQIASAGHWTTTITLVNNGATPAQVVLNFFDPNGSPLSLPLVFPQTSPTPAPAPTVSRTLNPGATLVIQTTGPDTQPVQTGWAQLITSGNIGGHAVFAQTSGSSVQEAVVPIETRTLGDFVLPFDNAGGYDTGVAIANGATASANIAVIIRDDTGATLQSQSITLPAQGQTSFNLATRFPTAAQKRGTVEFSAPIGGQISVLGLRFNPTGAFSTVPPLGR
jgi:hypothetical protein